MTPPRVLPSPFWGTINLCGAAALSRVLLLAGTIQRLWKRRDAWSCADSPLRGVTPVGVQGRGRSLEWAKRFRLLTLTPR